MGNKFSPSANSQKRSPAGPPEPLSVPVTQPPTKEEQFIIQIGLIKDAVDAVVVAVQQIESSLPVPEEEKKGTMYKAGKCDEDYMQLLLRCDGVEVFDAHSRAKRKELITEIQAHQVVLDEIKRKIQESS